MENVLISIGGISCGIISQDTRFLDILRARYQWFESAGPASYEILLRVVPLKEFALEDIVRSPYPQVSRVNSGNNYLIRQANSPFVAVVNTSSRKVLVRMWRSPSYFDYLLRILYTLILADEGGLLLQASAVSDGRRGSVFFGPSGSGKKTIARLATGRTVLTDELALIKPHNGRYRVYGTPFWGDFTMDRSSIWAELAGLYSLKKGQSNTLRTLDREQAVTELYRCVLFFSDDSHLSRQIRESCCTVVDQVPVFELQFKPDPSFWRVVNEHAKKGIDLVPSNIH